MTTERWEENKAAFAKFADYPLTLGLLLVAVGVVIGWYFFGGRETISIFGTFDHQGYSTNIFTEFLALGATVLILDRAAQRRERESYKRRLLREVRIQTPAVAVAALASIDHESWWSELYNSLQKNELECAQWEKANLHGKHLSRLHLYEASLLEANLLRANLEATFLAKAVLAGAKLEEANLQSANLGLANLQNANLLRSDLRGAILVDAQLNGADLWRAKLQGALLDNVHFDEATRLPDGTLWTPETDMRRFTDPNHPEFWTPE